MIVTKQKDFEFIKSELKDSRGVFIVGCGDCATLAQTGGEKEVQEMKTQLINANIPVAGNAVLNVPCDIRVVRKDFKLNKESMDKADTILVMACGSGAAAIRQITDKKIVPALDSLHVGTTVRIGQFQENCSLCGDCTIHLYGGYCVKTLCPKGLENGPCGGASDGKCEVNPENDCVWVKILKVDPGAFDKLKKNIVPPRNYDNRREK